MQEEVESKTAVLITNTSKLTGEELRRALAKVLEQSKNHKAKSAVPQGKMTVKELAAKDKGLQSIEVNGKNIGSFSHVARKYGIDFAPFKVKGENKYLVFFKAPDTDAMTAAFQEYTRKQVKKASRPSVLKALRRFKEQIKSAVVDRTRKKERER